MQVSDKINFFVELKTGKRSFQVRKEQIDSKKLALMSTIAEALLSVVVEGNKHILANAMGVFEHDFQPDFQYQIIESKYNFNPPFFFPPKSLFLQKHKKGSFEVSDQWTKFCSVEEVKVAPFRKRGPLNGRDITVFLHKDNFLAMDSVCYHFGGPLDLGDIEEVGERSCIICPYHRYKIDLSNGESLYKNLEGNIASKGKKQRVHETKVSEGHVMVRLDVSEPKIDSDDYAYKGLWAHPGSKTPPKGPIHSKRTDKNEK